jgi:hypothetical protein
MSVLMDDSAEMVVSRYGEASDPVGFKGLGEGSRASSDSAPASRATARHGGPPTACW